MVDDVEMWSGDAARPGEDSKKNMKYILHWSEAYGSKKYGFPLGNERFKNCQVSNCFTTDNRY